MRRFLSGLLLASFVLGIAPEIALGQSSNASAALSSVHSSRHAKKRKHAKRVKKAKKHRSSSATIQSSSVSS